MISAWWVVLAFIAGGLVGFVVACIPFSHALKKEHHETDGAG